MFALPSSAGVRSSTEALITPHRTSVSAKRPLKTGAAAVSASMSGARGANWSYKYLDSSMLLAWKVTCRQQQPMPKAMQSIIMAGTPLLVTASGGQPPSLNSGVFVSWKRGTRMSTLLPRRLRILAVSVGKRGCELMHASGTESDNEAGPPMGDAGWTKLPTPISGNTTMVGAISSSLKADSNRARRKRMFCSTCTKLTV
mmetsp:Transcript_55111/g.118271  ORF Transcript_55111/g.118271 Transcript_55111/m.118271 type:complete len:200 (+) Transcript_55111:1436-2035(+)